MSGMTCSDAQGHLSAYYDGELSSDMRAVVTRHLSTCVSCARLLAGYEKLSDLANRLDPPELPRADWNQFERDLEAGEPIEPARPAVTGRGIVLWRMGLIAAMIVVTVGIGWLAFHMSGPSHGDQQFAADFSSYIDQFQSDPDRAQQQLMAKYDGQTVDAKTAVRQLGYWPVVADRLPARYTVAGMYVLRMPCCTCVQTVCRDPHGNVLAIFEHDDEQPVWFGDRPSIRCRCGGKACCMCQLDSRLAVSWKVGTRYVTVVGARDVDEVRNLITGLDGAG